MSASSRPADRDPDDDGFKTFPEELTGLVAMANQASRNGIGQLIWFAYSCAKGQGGKRQPGIGSLLVGVTRLDAKVLKEEMAKCKPIHWKHFCGMWDAK